MASLVNPTKHLQNNKYQFLEDEGTLPNLLLFKYYSDPQIRQRHHRKLETSSFCKHTHTRIFDKTLANQIHQKKKKREYRPQPTTHNPNNARLVNYMKINQ